MMPGRFGAVVGVDGSPGSNAAISWACERADQIGAIRPVHAWSYPAAVWLPAAFSAPVVPPADQMQAAAEEAARGCEELLCDVIHHRSVVRRGDAAAVLLAESETARLLIVGTRGHGPIVDVLLGSVSRRCADKTSIPMVIVPLGANDADRPSAERIVVGVDGSDHAAAALRWAIQFARESDEIIALTTWSTPMPVGVEVPHFDLAALREGAQDTVDRAADTACAEANIEPSRVTRKIAEGDPRWIFKQTENEADLLVLGARGHTGIAHLILGSTTTSLIHSPNCPIAVVP